MTNEEAIEAIKFGHCNDIYYRKKYEEAINMGIKALEQINKIADIVDGTIDHFEYDDAMDMLYEIKGVIK